MNESLSIARNNGILPNGTKQYSQRKITLIVAGIPPRTWQVCSVSQVRLDAIVRFGNAETGNQHLPKVSKIAVPFNAING